ncbi:hypothetical protein SK128_001863 [Halocaridina rubra]|uniref:Uncharacterized protein n=1 Tax=Halocaridina rubra TaxID=373956 RepID=A0AAN8WHC0_HALRR
MTRILQGTLLVLALVLQLFAGQVITHNVKADVIEEVNAKQLENLVAESDYVAVYWSMIDLLKDQEVVAAQSTLIYIHFSNWQARTVSEANTCKQ